MPLEQKFNLSDKAPYAVFDKLDVDATIKQAHANRKDLAAMLEQTKAAEEQRKAATADRYPTVVFNGDYGDIGVNVRHFARNRRCAGHIERAGVQGIRTARRGTDAQSQLDTQNAQLSDLNAQVDADVRDALLDIAVGAEASGSGAIERGSGE